MPKNNEIPDVRELEELRNTIKNASPQNLTEKELMDGYRAAYATKDPILIKDALKHLLNYSKGDKVRVEDKIRIQALVRASLNTLQRNELKKQENQLSSRSIDLKISGLLVQNIQIDDSVVNKYKGQIRQKIDNILKDGTKSSIAKCETVGKVADLFLTKAVEAAGKYPSDNKTLNEMLLCYGYALKCESIVTPSLIGNSSINNIVMQARDLARLKNRERLESKIELNKIAARVSKLNENIISRPSIQNTSSVFNNMKRLEKQIGQIQQKPIFNNEEQKNKPQSEPQEFNVNQTSANSAATVSPVIGQNSKWLQYLALIHQTKRSRNPFKRLIGKIKQKISGRGYSR